jgi:hypothetical protein
VRLLGSIGDRPTVEDARIIDERLVHIHAGENTLSREIASARAEVASV